MEGFFDGAYVAFTTPPPSAAAHGVPVKAPTPPIEPVPREEYTYTEGVSETTPISAETPIPPEGVIPLATVQTEAASPVLPLVISTSDPFVALSQAVKDGSSLVVTPSSIPSFATRGPDTDLTSKGFEDILEDPDDESALKNRFFDSDEEKGAPPEPKFMGMCLPPFLFAKFTFFFFCYLFLIYMYLRCSLLQFPLYLYACFHVCRDL